MEAKTEQKFIKIKQYHATYHQISDYGLNITITNMNSLNRYSKKNLTLKNINFKGFEMALKQINQFSIEFKQVDKPETDQKQFLQIVVHFNSAYLHGISESFEIPFVRKISSIEMESEKLADFHQRLKQLTRKNSDKNTKYYKMIEQKIFKSNMNENYYEVDDYGDPNYELVEFEHINLPQIGKYKIELSFLVKINGVNYFLYIYKSRDYASPFPSGCMGLSSTNQFVPVSFSYTVDTRSTQEKSHTIFAYDIVDYPFEVKNVVITATKIQ